MKADDSLNQTGASLTRRAKTDALRALHVLAEAADNPAPDDTETPPLPANLRDQWQETYGAASSTETAQSHRVGWLQRLARFLGTPRGAWTGGLTAAAAAIMVLVFQQEPPASDTGGGIVTRGASHSQVENGTAAHLLVVGPAEESQALVAQLARAFPSRRIERADSVPSDTSGDVIIIDTAARQIRRAGRTAALPEATDSLASPEAVISAIEEMDEPEPR